jgi:lipoprotein-anchoring transpeptidase ErfK/SrfK
MLARRWFSRKYYNSPMPHSIFFHRGFAIHGSYEISRLGGPASHGCIRLHPANAAVLFGIVRHEGMGATTIVVQ